MILRPENLDRSWQSWVFGAHSFKHVAFFSDTSIGSRETDDNSSINLIMSRDTCHVGISLFCISANSTELVLGERVAWACFLRTGAHVGMAVDVEDKDIIAVSFWLLGGNETPCWFNLST